MKILDICNKPPFPPVDGGTIAVSNLLSEFAKLGHDISVITISTKKHPFDLSFNKKKNLFKYESVAINTELTFFSLWKNLFSNKFPLIVGRFYSKKFEKKLIKLLREEDYNLIQLEGLYLTPYLKSIRKFSPDSKISFRAHNVEHKIWLSMIENCSNPFRKIMYYYIYYQLKKYEIKQLKFFDFIIPISSIDTKIFESYNSSLKIHLAPFGYSINEDHKIHIIDKFCLYYIGALDWLPNQEGLLWFLKNVWIILFKKYPNLSFHIAGRNAPEKITSILKMPGINFYGEIKNVDEFLTDKSVLVSPLFAGSGVRVKIIEAMIKGKTVISTSLGAKGLNVTNNKNIFLANSATDYREKIEYLINNPQHLLKIGKNAFNFASTYHNNKKIAADLIEFYKSNLK